MKRREFITLAGAVAAWPVVARSQQALKLPTIGILGASTANAWAAWMPAFEQRLRELGWTNLTTAKALGLNISPMILARADEVIE